MFTDVYVKDLQAGKMTMEGKLWIQRLQGPGAAGKSCTQERTFDWLRTTRITPSLSVP